jgi:hypothetical protein
MNHIFTVSGRRCSWPNPHVFGYPISWVQPEDKAAFDGYTLAIVCPSYLTGTEWRACFVETITEAGRAGINHGTRKKDVLSHLRTFVAPVWPVYRLVLACRLHKRIQNPSDELTSLVMQARFEGLSHADTTKTVKQKGITIQ